MRNQILRAFRYEAWANRRVLESLKQPGVPDDAIRLFAHILAGQKVWLARLQGEDPSRIEIWPGRSLEECEKLFSELGSAIDQYLQSHNETDLEEGVSYQPSNRKHTYCHTPFDILSHLAFHSHYHRGQIAVHVRQAGGTPATTDFIVYLREVPEEAIPARPG